MILCLYILFCHALRGCLECRHRATVLVSQNHYGENLYSITVQSEGDMLRSVSNKRNVTIFCWNKNGTVVNGSGV